MVYIMNELLGDIVMGNLLMHICDPTVLGVHPIFRTLKFVFREPSIPTSQCSNTPIFRQQ